MNVQFKLQMKRPRISALPMDMSNMTCCGAKLAFGGMDDDENIAAAKTRLEVKEIMTNTEMFALTEEDILIQYRNQLGQGAFCNVYPVHIRNGKTKSFNKELPPFALKEIQHDIIKNPNPRVYKEAYEDLAKEAQIMRSLQHDNILPIMGMSRQTYDEDNIMKESLFIIVEKLESTLDSKLDKWANVLGLFRQITPKAKVMSRIKTVALEIGLGLQYIHSQHYLFRDLKPANIGFDRSGRVKIFDFGLAVHIPPSSAKGSDARKVKGRVGTVRYMAPEVKRGDLYSYPIDVYAYAILLWQIITSRTPFEEEIPESDMFGPPQDLPDDKRPNLKYVESKELVVLLESSWKTNPEARWTLDKMLIELQIIGARMQSRSADRKKKFPTSEGGKRTSHVLWFMKIFLFISITWKLFKLLCGAIVEMK